MLGSAAKSASRALETVTEQVRQLVRGRPLKQTPNDKVDNLCLLSTVAMLEAILGAESLAHKTTYLGLQQIARLIGARLRELLGEAVDVVVALIGVCWVYMVRNTD